MLRATNFTCMRCNKFYEYGMFLRMFPTDTSSIVLGVVNSCQQITHWYTSLFGTSFFSQVQPPETSVDRQADNRRRLWDDDYVLKRQHSALIPAFDPRPGRTNVAQTQDVEIPDTGKTM